MRTRVLAWLGVLGVTLGSQAQVPESLVLDGIPAAPPGLANALTPYLEVRSAVFQDWHPAAREMLITTRFGNSMQLHRVGHPGGARQQITFGN